MLCAVCSVLCAACCMLCVLRAVCVSLSAVCCVWLTRSSQGVCSDCNPSVYRARMLEYGPDRRRFLTAAHSDGHVSPSDIPVQVKALQAREREMLTYSLCGRCWEGYKETLDSLRGIQVTSYSLLVIY